MTADSTAAGAPKVLCEPVLIEAGIPHGFGRRGSGAPESTVFPVQVHGVGVLDADAASTSRGAEADAVFTAEAGRSVGIVTADCVPILAATRDGRVVAAIHAGWRGLAAGVIEAGIGALRARAGADAELVCAIGPCARGCCYEVDEPVRRALSPRYEDWLAEAMVASEPGHYLFDPGQLAMRILEALAGRGTRVGIEHRVCTICDPDRFESHRRDGAESGRLRHFISKPVTISRQG